MRNNAEGTLEEPFFVALARVDISDYARRVERLYRWYLDQREDEENDEDDDDKENDRTNSKYSRYHPGAAIQKFLNEYYFEPLAKLATKHEGTVLNFAGDAACCVFRRRQRRRRRCRGDDDDDVEEEEEEEEAKAALKKRAESFAEEVVRGRWLFSYRLRCSARKVREETEAHFFFRDVRVRIAVASGNAVETFLGGFQGRYERVMFGEACENLAREARKAKPRKLADDGDNPERKGLFRREKKKQIITDGRKTPMITKIQGDADFCTTVRDETVAIVFIHVSLLTSISTCEARTLGRFVQHAQKLCAHHRGTFLQLGGDEGDSLAIVVAFRTKFAKDSLLAKTVASRNALRFSRAVARWVQKKKNNNNKNKKTKTTKTKRKGKKSRPNAATTTPRPKNHARRFSRQLRLRLRRRPFPRRLSARVPRHRSDRKPSGEVGERPVSSRRVRDAADPREEEEEEEDPDKNPDHHTRAHRRKRHRSRRAAVSLSSSSSVSSSSSFRRVVLFLSESPRQRRRRVGCVCTLNPKQRSLSIFGKHF